MRGASHDIETPSHHMPGAGGPLALRELTLDAELYGGLGNSSKGITASGKVTEHDLGVNLVSHWSNGWMLQAGASKGLTSPSQRGLLRLMAGYDF